MVEIIKEIARCLANRQIPYMIVGGQAVLNYGEPRLTKDIDITVALPPDKFETVLNAVSETFAPLSGNLEDFVKKSWVLPVKHVATGTVLDITFTDTIFEKEAIAKGRKLDIDGVLVNFISPEHLIVEKIFAGRPKDLLDVENILNVQRLKLDFNEIEEKLKTFDNDFGQSDFLELWKTIKKKFDHKWSS